MSKKIYVTRHGESQWNVECKVQGVTDTPLTARGIEQAHELAKKIKESGIKIDEIFYSPLSRAADTAKIVAEENSLPLSLEPRLLEQNFGDFEGHEWEKHPGVFHEAKKQFACDYNGGESMLRLGQRIYNLLDELKARSEKDNKTFLLVTHGGIARMIHSYFNSETNEEFSSTNIANCQVMEYCF